jgi:hypothetical protein
MKKTLTLLLAVAFIIPARAQEDKKFRFGLKMTPSINWLKVDDKKTFEPNGAGMKFSYGLLTEFHLAGPAWLSTGFQVDYDGGKIATTATSAIDNSVGKMLYAYNDNNGFLEVSNWITSTDTTYESYLLRERKYRSLYLTLPIHIRLKTKELGLLTYFGNIGLNTSIHLKTRVNDVINTGSTGYLTSATLEDLVISDDMNFIRLGLVLGGGAELNLSGSTSLLFGLHFFQGFTNTVKGESKYLADVEQSATFQPGSTTIGYTAQKQKFLNNNIGLTIGVLF